MDVYGTEYHEELRDWIDIAATKLKIIKTPAIVVTGAGGFIGSNVVRSLLDAGIKVVAIDDLSSERIQETLMEFPQLEKVFDLQDVIYLSHKELASYLEPFAGVIHLGANSSIADSRNPQLRKDIFHRNYIFTRNMYWATMDSVFPSGATTFRPSFVFASSAAVYGSDPSNFDRIQEERDINPSTWYGWTKSQAEQALNTWPLLRMNVESPVKVTILRPYNVFGPGDERKPKESQSFITRCIIDWYHHSKPLVFHHPDGRRAARDFVPVSQVVRAVFASLLRPTKESMQPVVVDVGNGDTWDLLTLARRIGQMMVTYDWIRDIDEETIAHHESTSTPMIPTIDGKIIQNPTKLPGFQFRTEADLHPMKEYLGLSRLQEWEFERELHEQIRRVVSYVEDSRP